MRIQRLGGNTKNSFNDPKNFLQVYFSPQQFQSFFFFEFVNHLSEAADLAPAQLEALRPNVVLDGRATCPISGSSSSMGRGCPFRRMVDGVPLLEKVGGTEEIEKILTLMEREAQRACFL